MRELYKINNFQNYTLSDGNKNFTRNEQFIKFIIMFYISLLKKKKKEDVYPKSKKILIFDLFVF